MIGKKRGGTHVGVILSFVIFITFLIFLYTTIQPAVKLNKDKQMTLDTLKEEIIDEVSAELTNAAVIAKIAIEPPPTGTTTDCILLNSPSSGSFIPSSLVSNNLVVRQLDGGTETIQQSSLSYGQLKIKLKAPVNPGGSAEILFKVNYANEIFDSAGFLSCSVIQTLDYSLNTPLPDNKYTLSLKTNKHVFKSKIEELNTAYGNNYNRLKQQLNVPSGTEFSFSFIDEETNEIIEPAPRETSASVYSAETPTQFVNQTASINSGTLMVKVW